METINKGNPITTSHRASLGPAFTDEELQELYRRAREKFFSSPDATRAFAKSLEIWDEDGNLNENYR